MVMAVEAVVTVAVVTDVAVVANVAVVVAEVVLIPGSYNLLQSSLYIKFNKCHTCILYIKILYLVLEHDNTAKMQENKQLTWFKTSKG